MNVSYSVAIRTLGTSGEKYVKLLDSIKRQTIQPEKVIVVLPTEYTCPIKHLGIEQFVFCKKSMILQRIEALNYIDSEYTLFCDDDVEFDPNFVEKLLIPLIDGKCSCTAGPLLEFFPPNRFKYWIASLLGGACVMLRGRSTQYVRILPTGGWSYNHNIDTLCNKIYETDSLAWTCFCIKTDVLRSIRFEDEIWLDSNGYAAYDDQTMAYKLRINNHKIGIVSNALYKHNDGKNSTRNMKLEPIYARSFNHYVFWYRFLYAHAQSSLKKIWLKVCINYYVTMNIVYSFMKFIFGRCSFEEFKTIRQGFFDARRFVNSDDYKSIPSPVLDLTEKI